MNNRFWVCVVNYVKGPSSQTGVHRVSLGTETLTYVANIDA